MALKVVIEWLLNLENEIDDSNSKKFTKIENLEILNLFKFGKNKYQIHEFEKISKCAYFDYQREKIYLRTNRSIQRALKTLEKKTKKNIK